MTLTIDIPAKVVERAASLGVPIETLVSQAIDGIGEESLPPGFVRLGSGPLDPGKAAAIIGAIASCHTLDGLKIKDLINEGRH